MPTIRIFCFLILFLFYLSPAQGQKKDSSVYVSRIEGTILFDGIVNEPEWEEIKPLPLTSHWPEYGKQSLTNTEVRLAYNDEYLYYSSKIFNERENIQGPTYKRDAWGMTMDQQAIILDTYNDNENALIFIVTPTGSRIDLTMINDAADGEFNLTWDSFWDAEVSETNDGWSAEVRIPFSSLKFQSVADEVTMGISVYCYQANGIIMDTYPDIPAKWGFWSFIKPSQTQKVVFRNIESDNPFYISPYVLGGLEQEVEINEEETGYDVNNLGDFEAGLDVKYAVSDNLTLDVTVNTDFAQVEADDAQVNLTRFSLFFPEKRKFFLERESNFDFNLGGPNQLFYSRRIGLIEDQKVRILGGARLVGRTGKWDIGLMNLQTGREKEIPTENFGVYRLRRQVFNSYSYMGGIVTTRIAENGYYNIGYGLDGIIRVIGDEYLSYNLAQTVDEELNKKISGFDAARISVNWERRTFEGLSYNLGYDFGGVNYEPGVGFEERNDFTRLGSSLSYGWLPGEDSKIQRFSLHLSGSGYLRNTDGSLESMDIGPGWNLAGKNGDAQWGGLSFITESLTDTFKLADDAFVPNGKYSFINFNFNYNSPRGKFLRTNVDMDVGSFFDGSRISMGIAPEWNVSRHLELRVYYQYNRVRFDPRNQDFTAHIARFKVLISFNTKLEVSSYIQYNSASKASVINFRLRYNPKDGNDLYLVYNEGGDYNRNRYDFSVPTVTYRAILLKYVHTFIL